MAVFDYLLSRIKNAAFDESPFKHLYMENFFDVDDFKDITSAPEVSLPPVKTDEDLIEQLYQRGYKEIEFPGTTTNVGAYLEWRKDPSTRQSVDPDLCEGFGVTMRLLRTSPESKLRQVNEFFQQSAFWQVLADKFGVDIDEVRTDFGLQKYLDGYEISPHPDIRGKALTFMININPGENAEELNIHTHYLKFKPERDGIRDFWRENVDLDRCWVPWSWCDTDKKQIKNNSIVIFAPSNDTMHAVKASYDHLQTQRTQLYGNLWFKKSTVKRGTTWRDFANGMPEHLIDKPKHKGERLTFVAKSDTFAKASMAPSWELSEADKIGVKSGERIAATIDSDIDEYFVVDAMNHNATTTNKKWYLFKAHWECT